MVARARDQDVKVSVGSALKLPSFPSHGKQET